jgi:hypothetical protein
MTRGERQHAAELERYMGADIGVRRSLAEIARELPTLWRRTPLTGEAVDADREVAAKTPPPLIHMPVLTENWWAQQDSNLRPAD